MIIHQTDAQHLDIVLPGYGTEQSKENEEIPLIVKNQIPIDRSLIDMMERPHPENPISSLHGFFTLRFMQIYNI
jgi:hypothetical protein